MTIYGVPDDYQGLPMMKGWIRQAQSGDTEAARRILEDFIGAVEANTDNEGRPHRKPSGIGTQIDERAIRYLAACFKLILDGVSADKALGLKPGEGGRPRKSSKRNRDLDIATEVAGLIQQGQRATVAYENIAESRSLEGSGVKKIYLANKAVADIAAKVITRLNREKT